MSELAIILTVIVCIGFAGLFFYVIYKKEKVRLKEEEELTDDYRDEELNSVFDDYGKNEFDF